MSATLIKNGFVITMDPRRRVLDDGAVCIDADRITDVGTSAELAARYPDAKVIDAARKAVLPGLIDGHAHAGHGLVKTLGGERSDLWYQACETIYTVGSDEEFWYAEAQLAALERLRFGVTTGVSLLGGGDSIMRTDSPEYAAAHCAAVAAVGTRSVVAIGPTRPPFPRRYARWPGGQREDYDVSFEQQLASCRATIERWHRSHGLRLNVAMLSPTLRREHLANLSDAEREQVVSQTRQARDLGREFGTVFTQDGHTRGSVKFAHEIGILGPQALLSHSTELSDEEIAICRDTDTRIAHNPSAVAPDPDRIRDRRRRQALRRWRRDFHYLRGARCSLRQAASGGFGKQESRNVWPVGLVFVLVIVGLSQVENGTAYNHCDFSSAQCAGCILP